MIWNKEVLDACSKNPLGYGMLVRLEYFHDQKTSQMKTWRHTINRSLGKF